MSPEDSPKGAYPLADAPVLDPTSPTAPSGAGASAEAATGAQALAKPGREAFRLLFATLLVVGVGNTMLLSVLPSIARDLSLNAAQMGAVFSFSALLWMLCSPLWGRQSDRWGRKPTIAVGLAGYAVSMAGVATVAGIGMLGWLAPTAVFILLVLARAIFGAFGSAANPAAQAYVADHTDRANRTEEIAGLTSAFALGSALGPGLCVLVVGFMGPIAPLVITALAAGVGAWAVLRFLPEGAPQDADSQPASGFKAALALANDPRVSAHVMYGLGLSILGAVIAQTFGFFVMDRLSLTPAQAVEPTGAGFMVGALAVLVAQTLLLPRLKLTPRGLMMLGAALIGLGLLIQIIAPTLGVLLFSQLVQGLGFGLARPGMSGGASLSVRWDEQGAVAGLMVGVSGAGFIISPLLGGWLYDAAGHETPYWVCLAIVIVMGVFAWRSRRLKAREVAPIQPPEQGVV
jgi:MFS family permease